MVARLADALDGRELLNTRFDRTMDNLLAVQDEITEAAFEAVEVELTLGEGAKVWRDAIASPETYREFSRAVELGRTYSQDGVRQSEKLSLNLLKENPKSAAILNHLGWMTLAAVELGMKDDPAQAMAEAEQYGRRALDETPGFPHSLFLVGTTLVYEGKLVEAQEYADRIVAAGSSDAEALAGAGYIRIAGGQPGEGVELLAKGMRLFPYHPQWMPLVRGSGLLMLGRYEELRALARGLLAKETHDVRAHPVALAYLAASAIFVGEESEAKAHVRRLMALKPDVTTDFFLDSPYIRPYSDRAFLDRYVAALQSAGVPAPTPALDDAAPPRVAVLPFENLGGDDWFVDGLVEDVITRLSRFDDLAVISRRSTFLWKGRDGDVEEIAADLDADYLVEGSVRRAVDAIRISARLVDSKAGVGVWAEEWTLASTAEAVFEVQDELTRALAAKIGGMGGVIAESRRNALVAETPPDLAGYDCVLLARYVLTIYGSRDLYDQAQACLDRTIDASPGNANAWAWRANILSHGVTAGFVEANVGLPQMFAAADRAFEIAPDSPTGRQTRINVQFWRQDRNSVIAVARESAKRDAGDAEAMSWAGFWLIHMGLFKEGESVLDKAFALTPNPPWFYHFGRFHARYGLGDIEGALAAVHPPGRETEIYWWHLFAAVALVELGRIREAEAGIAKARSILADLEPVVSQTPGQWWWALPDKGAGYLAAFKTAGLDLD